MKLCSMSVVLLASALSACVETVELAPLYVEDHAPAFSDGSISIPGTMDPSTAPVLTWATNLSLDVQARNKIQDALKKVSYTLTPEMAADVFQRLSTGSINPALDLSQEQKDDLLLNNLGKYRKYARIHNQKQEIEQALDEIAAACGKVKNDPALFSSSDFFKTYVSYLALSLEMERFINAE